MTFKENQGDEAMCGSVVKELIWKKSVPHKGNSKCKGLEMETFFKVCEEITAT